MLTAAGIARRHGVQDVLRDVTLAIGPGDRIGVVGPNGIGKSTLLRILAGTEAPDAGTVARAPATLEVGLLPQEPDAAPGETLGAYLARRSGVAEAEAHLDELTARMAADPDAVTAYTEALERFLHLGGEDHAARAETVVRQVGLPAGALALPVAALSGGNAARAGLSALLLSRFDVFLLDEPTNNLDFAGLDALERFVDATDAAVVAVSHDRAFLARCCDTIVDIEPGTRTAAIYHGGYEAYLEARALALEHARAAYAGFTQERDRLRGGRAARPHLVRVGRQAREEGLHQGQARAPRRGRGRAEPGRQGRRRRAPARAPRAHRPRREAVRAVGAAAAAGLLRPRRRRRGSPGRRRRSSAATGRSGR